MFLQSVASEEKEDTVLKESDTLAGTSVFVEDDLKMSADSRLCLSSVLCDQRYMEVCIVEEERPFDWRGILVGLVEEFKQSCSNIHWDPHNDALRHT